jgi:glycosyltransferase involved in cell wall biosynthesis
MDVLAAAGELLHATHPESSLILAGEPRGFNVKPRAGVVIMPKAIPGERAQELIGNARALLVGSRFDASPHVIMEAFQAGTPVIASRVCGIPEVVTPEMGYLVDPGDAEGFALAMRACLEEDVSIQRARVYRQYLDRFGGWETVAHRVISKIDDVIGSGEEYRARESRGWQSLCAQP